MGKSINHSSDYVGLTNHCRLDDSGHTDLSSARAYNVDSDSLYMYIDK